MSECGGSIRRLGALDSRFEQGRYLGPVDASSTVFIGTASGVVRARTIKRLPPGERWNDSLLDESHGSESAPNALEDDDGRVGTRVPVLHPHAAVARPFFEQFGFTNNCLWCANARAGRKQAMDHSRRCRSRMESTSVTTTEGHMRLERGRERFAQFR